METYASILLIASPLFFLFVVAEKWYGKIRYKHDFKHMDTISSLSSGLTNTLKDVLGIGISILSYTWLESKVGIFSISYTWVNVLIAFIVLDFAGYWGHRINHAINFFWNQHLIHHSSEEFNLACALRQSISNLIGFFTIFLLPAAFLGVDPKIIGTVAPIHLFAQFWYHTVYIGKMGWIEKILVTPSHHRVHHAINPEYLDKNLGQIFIFWDKWFGTFQEELDHVPPVYGITVPVKTWNPIKINFLQWWQLLNDSVRTSTLWDKIRLWFMPTGWRPADVITSYPVDKIEDPYTYQKYYPSVHRSFEGWSWVQFFASFGFLNILFVYIADLEVSQMMLMGAFIFLSIYAFTEAMDKNPKAWLWELAKNALGAALLYQNGGWFLAPEWLTWVIVPYFLVSVPFTYWFLKNQPIDGYATS